MNDVVENGPAWESGVRAGDVIVTVNDWLIVLMDRPQVIWSLLRLMMIRLCSLQLGVHTFEEEKDISPTNQEMYCPKKTFIGFPGFQHFSSFQLSWL